MKTWVETFQEVNLFTLEKEINVYAEENNAEIVSVSFAVRGFDYSADTYLALVAFKGEKRGW
jgi:hypothetical protein